MHSFARKGNHVSQAFDSLLSKIENYYSDADYTFQDAEHLSRIAISEYASTQNALVASARQLSTTSVQRIIDLTIEKRITSDPTEWMLFAANAVDNVINYAHNGVLASGLSEFTDLLPVGHPSRTNRGAMTASALNQVTARWTAADPRIESEDARYDVYKAYSSKPGSVEAEFSSLKLSALVASGKLPADIVLPITAAFKLSFAVRSAMSKALAAVRRRHRNGRFAEEFGRLKGFFSRGDGSLFSESGRIVGAQKNTNNFLVEYKNSDEIPDGIYVMDAAKTDPVKAILSKRATKGIKSARNIETPSQAEKDAAIPLDEFLATRKDAPEGWTKNEDGSFTSATGQTLRQVDARPEGDYMFEGAGESGAQDPEEPLFEIRDRDNNVIGVAQDWAGANKIAMTYDALEEDDADAPGLDQDAKKGSSIDIEHISNQENWRSPDWREPNRKGVYESPDGRLFVNLEGDVDGDYLVVTYDGKNLEVRDEDVLKSLVSDMYWLPYNQISKSNAQKTAEEIAEMLDEAVSDLENPFGFEDDDSAQVGMTPEEIEEERQRQIRESREDEIAEREMEQFGFDQDAPSKLEEWKPGHFYYENESGNGMVVVEEVDGKFEVGTSIYDLIDENIDHRMETTKKFDTKEEALEEAQKVIELLDNSDAVSRILENDYNDQSYPDLDQDGPGLDQDAPEEFDPSTPEGYEKLQAKLYKNRIKQSDDWYEANKDWFNKLDFDHMENEDNWSGSPDKYEYTSPDGRLRMVEDPYDEVARVQVFYDGKNVGSFRGNLTEMGPNPKKIDLSRVDFGEGLSDAFSEDDFKPETPGLDQGAKNPNWFDEAIDFDDLNNQDNWKDLGGDDFEYVSPDGKLKLTWSPDGDSGADASGVSVEYDGSYVGNFMATFRDLKQPGAVAEGLSDLLGKVNFNPKDLVKADDKGEYEFLSDIGNVGSVSITRKYDPNTKKLQWEVTKEASNLIDENIEHSYFEQKRFDSLDEARADAEAFAQILNDDNKYSKFLNDDWADRDYYDGLDQDIRPTSDAVKQLADGYDISPLKDIRYNFETSQYETTEDPNTFEADGDFYEFGRAVVTMSEYAPGKWAATVYYGDNDGSGQNIVELEESFNSPEEAFEWVANGFGKEFDNSQVAEGVLKRQDLDEMANFLQNSKYKDNYDEVRDAYDELNSKFFEQGPGKDQIVFGSGGNASYQGSDGSKGSIVQDVSGIDPEKGGPVTWRASFTNAEGETSTRAFKENDKTQAESKAAEWLQKKVDDSKLAAFKKENGGLSPKQLEPATSKQYDLLQELFDERDDIDPVTSDAIKDALENRNLSKSQISALFGDLQKKPFKPGVDSTKPTERMMSSLQGYLTTKQISPEELEDILGQLESGLDRAEIEALTSRLRRKPNNPDAVGLDQDAARSLNEPGDFVDFDHVVEGDGDNWEKVASDEFKYVSPDGRLEMTHRIEGDVEDGPRGTDASYVDVKYDGKDIGSFPAYERDRTNGDMSDLLDKFFKAENFRPDDAPGLDQDVPELKGPRLNSINDDRAGDPRKTAIDDLISALDKNGSREEAENIYLDRKSWADSEQPAIDTYGDGDQDPQWNAEYDNTTIELIDKIFGDPDVVAALNNKPRGRTEESDPDQDLVDNWLDEVGAEIEAAAKQYTKSDDRPLSERWETMRESGRAEIIDSVADYIIEQKESNPGQFYPNWAPFALNSAYNPDGARAFDKPYAYAENYLDYLAEYDPEMLDVISKEIDDSPGLDQDAPTKPLSDKQMEPASDAQYNYLESLVESKMDVDPSVAAAVAEAVSNKNLSKAQAGSLIGKLRPLGDKENLGRYGKPSQKMIDSVNRDVYAKGLSEEDRNDILRDINILSKGDVSAIISQLKEMPNVPGGLDNYIKALVEKGDLERLKALRADFRNESSFFNLDKAIDSLETGEDFGLDQDASPTRASGPLFDRDETASLIDELEAAEEAGDTRGLFLGGDSLKELDPEDIGDATLLYNELKDTENSLKPRTDAGRALEAKLVEANKKLLDSIKSNLGPIEFAKRDEDDLGSTSKFDSAVGDLNDFLSYYYPTQASSNMETSPEGGRVGDVRGGGWEASVRFNEETKKWEANLTSPGQDSESYSQEFDDQEDAAEYVSNELERNNYESVDVNVLLLSRDGLDSLVSEYGDNPEELNVALASAIGWLMDTNRGQADEIAKVLDEVAERLGETSAASPKA